MRITNNLLIHNMLWNMNNNLVSMHEKQQKLSTGKRVHKPSDDPIGVTKIIKLKSDIVENQQYKGNVNDAKSWLDMSENSLMDVKEILQRARELAVQGINDTNTPEDADKIAKEIDQLIEELIVNANSTMAGRYLFSGFNTDKPLLNEDGTFNVNVTAEKMKEFVGIAYEVAIGEKLEVGTNYLNVFGLVELNNLITEKINFGTPSYKTVKGDAATHGSVQGPVDHKKDMTGTPFKIKVDGKEFTVDHSKLNGSISQKEFVEVLLAAEESGTGVKLSDVAEVFFVKGKNDLNKTGELVVESKTFGISSTAEIVPKDIYKDNPELINGVTPVAPVKSKVTGNLAFTNDLSSQTLSFTFSGTTYTVDTSTMTAGHGLTYADVETLIKNATGGGIRLGDVADVELTATGDLTIANKLAVNETPGFTTAGGAFTLTASTNGVEQIFGVKAKIDHVIDYSKDISTGSNPYVYKLNGVDYTVDSTKLNGALSQLELIEAIEDAVDSGGNKLKTVADISFTAHEGKVGTVVIKSKIAFNSTPGMSGAGATTLTKTYPDTIAAKDKTNATLTGIANLSDAEVASATGTQSFVVTYNGKSQRIDIDMQTVTSVADLQVAVNQKLDLAFGNGKVVMGGNNNAPVTFTATSSNPGESVELKVDVIVATKSKLIEDMKAFSAALSSKDNVGIQKFQSDVDVHLDNTIATLADIGAKDNRLTFIKNRIDDNNLAMTDILSKVQDIDYSKVLIRFKSLESIYRASLAVGARVIQPTLVDFIK